jgi:hypothetical protein
VGGKVVYLLNHPSNQSTSIIRLTISIIILVDIGLLFAPSVLIAQLSVPTSPLEAKGSVPPQIAMIYNGKEYFGDLVSFVVNSTASNSTGTTAPIGQSAVTPANITAPPPSKVVTVQKDSVINFVIIKGNNTNNNTSTNNLKPSSLSIAVYNIKGKGIGLLNTVEHSNTNRFVVNLDRGQQYILLSVATWLAQKANIGMTNAFAYYSYRI